MRKLRLLEQDAWYVVRTAINEAVGKVFFDRVFGEARERFEFELRGFALVEGRLSFYIRPADGSRLPAIMQWLKQTFAVRFNLSRGRSRHI
jgi:hypothetical protein